MHYKNILIHYSNPSIHKNHLNQIIVKTQSDQINQINLKDQTNLSMN